MRNLRLSVVRMHAVLAIVVRAEDVRFKVNCRADEGERAMGHAGDGFQGDRVLDGSGGVFAPGEGRVSGHENSWNGDGIDRREAFDDDRPRRIALDLLRLPFAALLQANDLGVQRHDEPRFGARVGGIEQQCPGFQDAAVGFDGGVQNGVHQRVPGGEEFGAARASEVLRDSTTAATDAGILCS